MLITLLSVPLLGETIGLHRLASVSVGMLGVIVITASWIKFSAREPTGYWRCYDCSFQIWTRRLKSDGTLSAMVMVQHFCYLVAGTLMMVANVIWPYEPTGNTTLDFLLRAQ